MGQEAAQTENIEIFGIVIESLNELQVKQKLFEKRIFKEQILDFVSLMLSSWQSGVVNRVQDELVNVLFLMVNVKGMMTVFVEKILPEYLNNHSGIEGPRSDDYKKSLHVMVLKEKNEENGDIQKDLVQAVFDLGIESTFKFS